LTITDLRNFAGSLLDQVKHASQPIGILRRNQLEQLAEDILDRQIVASRFRSTKKTDFVPYRQ